jgi:hypothetical protein
VGTKTRELNTLLKKKNDRFKRSAGFQREEFEVSTESGIVRTRKIRNPCKQEKKE